MNSYSSDKEAIANIIKDWAQSHDLNLKIAANESGAKGIEITSIFFNWLIKQTEVSIDLNSLLEAIHKHISSNQKKTYDGMFCSNCGSWYQFAEPNQPDGALICYSCRFNPFT